MEKLLFFLVKPDLQYLVFSQLWAVRIVKKPILSITRNDIIAKGETLTASERKLLNIFCLNQLSKFYTKNYPKKMNNLFINNILQIIDNCKIQISYYQYEVLNYWRTILLARSRNKKTILTHFDDPIKPNKAFFKIHNLAVYQDVRESNRQQNNSGDQISTNIKSFPRTTEQIKKLWNRYQLVMKGTIFFQTQSFALVNEFPGCTPSPGASSVNFFFYNRINKIVVCDQCIHIEMTNNQKYIIVTPYADCELFWAYISMMKIYLKRHDISLINTINN